MSNRDRAVEIMRSFWNDGRYAVGFDEIAKALAEAGLLAPEPAAPRTMAEIEWNDAEHHLAEASVAVEKLDGNINDTVIMLGVNRFGNISALDTSTWAAWALSKDTLTPTGRKYRLEPEDDTPTSTIEDKPTPESALKPAAPRPEDVPVGEPWQVEIAGRAAIGYRNDPEDMVCWTVVYRDEADHDWMHDGDVMLIARLVPETTEQQALARDIFGSFSSHDLEHKHVHWAKHTPEDDEPVFGPDYIYRDRHGDDWEYQTRTMRWRCCPKIGVSFEVTDSPPAERGPYTRIEDTK